MAKFCRYCGSPVSEGAKFCRNCGKALALESPRPETAPAQKKEPARPRTEKTAARQPSARVNEPAAKAKPTETAAVQEKPVETASERKTTKTAKQPAEKSRSRRSSQKNASEKQSGVPVPQVRTLAASSSAGEIDCGVMDLPGFSGVTEPITKVLSPIAGIFQGIGSWIGGIFRIFKNPASLIGTLALAALYVFLSQNRNSDSAIIKWVSLLTYAEGGFDRSSMLGKIGGTLGKGTVAAALFSFFNGGLPRFFKGIGALFKGHGEKRSFLSILFGIILGGAVYFAFVGRYPSQGSFVVGIAGAMLSLEALGSGSGKLYTLAQSLTSKVTNTIRVTVQGKCDGILIGLTIGFVLAAVLSHFA
ncbi:MAG: zinc-ribbon domain-containing protein [Anaerolineaceae bacterium]|nr:zinc-ribbon domain-containing protein [Anaerolineaceae bacterium]